MWHGDRWIRVSFTPAKSNTPKLSYCDSLSVFWTENSECLRNLSKRLPWQSNVLPWVPRELSFVTTVWVVLFVTRSSDVYKYATISPECKYEWGSRDILDPVTLSAIFMTGNVVDLIVSLNSVNLQYLPEPSGVWFLYISVKDRRIDEKATSHLQRTPGGLVESNY